MGALIRRVGGSKSRQMALVGRLTAPQGGPKGQPKNGFSKQNNVGFGALDKITRYNNVMTLVTVR